MKDFFLISFLETFSPIYKEYNFVGVQNNIYVFSKSENPVFDFPKKEGNCWYYIQGNEFYIDKDLVKKISKRTKKYWRKKGWWNHNFNNNDYFLGKCACSRIFDDVIDKGLS